ncbi:hypothetical protein LNKW23_35680 [Paralimibaculum aggregatum]|uniref:PKD domain-containing protein n=1 Tax=Paralimibaculum aggregatum TaxID=3036245 RepID=A0ABQ6LRL8_9RHOB|nr:right-handed parallel beta-helix repeat-containing protein [Limibaculum sp. NKW23]GMG84353.1 hypothetical protein LNKW23_35680 [Limibaculum sp. NKW23]
MTDTAIETVTVASSAELRAALQTAAAGPMRILVAPGEYDLMLRARHGDTFAIYDHPVEIASADPADPAEFTWLELDGVANITLDGLLFDFDVEDRGEEWKPFTIGEGAQGITIRNSVFDGDMRPGDSIPEGGGFPMGYGLVVRDAGGITLEDNLFRQFFRGIMVQDVADIAIRGNEITEMRSDGIVVPQATDILIEDNYFHDFMQATETGDHVDFIQFWTATQTRPSENITIRGNLFDSGNTADGVQSIFMRNEMVDTGTLPFEQMAYRNVLIEENVVRSGHTHGITVGEAMGVTVRNNTLLHNATGSYGPPSINVEKPSLDVVIVNNIASNIRIGEGDEWYVDNNLIVQDVSPNHQNFYDELFVNARAAHYSDLADWQALPGGVIESMGVGASRTRFEATPESLTALAMVREVPGRHGSFTFDGGLTADAEGLVDAAEAEFLWDFGDGSKASGIAATHVYAEPGGYIVRLEVHHADGSMDVGTSFVEVPETSLLHLEIGAEGPVDRSPFAETLELSGAETLTEGRDGGLAVVLGDAVSPHIARGATPQLLDQLQGTMMFGLRAATGTPADAGVFFRMHGDRFFTIEGDGEVSVSFSTTQGSHALRSVGANLLDGNWHDLAVVFDAFAGRLEIFVDGVSVGVGSFAGATPPASYYDLQLGAAASTAQFDGALDYLEISAIPLDADAIGQRQGGLAAPGPTETGSAGAPGPDGAPDADADAGNDSGNDTGSDSGGLDGGTGFAGEVPPLPAAETELASVVDRLYLTAFGRAADAAGAAFWEAALSAGHVAPDGLADRFADSIEFLERHGEASAEALADALLAAAPWPEDSAAAAEAALDALAGAGADAGDLLDFAAFGPEGLAGAWHPELLA